MRRGLGGGRDDVRLRLPGARLTLALAGAALLIGAALAGSARPLLAQDPGGTVATDRAALVALYEATDGPHWTLNANWGGTRALADWLGVTTDASGRVTHLSLSGNNLRGTLPAALGDLANLRYLSLESNHLSGPIPSTLGGLSGLESLSLRGNELSGEIPAALGRLSRLQRLALAGNGLRGSIPSTLGDLTDLESLDLGGNELGGEVPAALGNLVNLRELDLGGNELSGEVPATLGNLVNLWELDLGSNELSGEVPATLGNLVNLWELDLGGNELRGLIPDFLADLSDLTHLDLGDNRLRGPIPDFLGDLSDLTHLDLGDNRLSGSIPDFLGDLSDLTHLDLGDNHLGGSIPDFLGDLSNLTDLDLGDNELDGPIPAALGDLPNLEFLRLAGNTLDGCVPHGLRDLLAIPPRPSRFPAHDFSALVLPFCMLRNLHLGGVILDPPFAGGTIPVAAASVAYTATVPATVAETVVTATLYDASDQLIISKGGVLYASGATLPLDPGPNSITIEVVPADEAFPIWEVVIVKVTREQPAGQDPAGVAADRAALLALYRSTDGPSWTGKDNWASDEPLGAWHGVNVGANGRVTDLALARNNLTGILPAALGDLADLTDLDLHGNHLHGLIPPALSDLSNLEVLDLHGNRLGGVLPHWLGDLASLRDLELSGNRLRGPLPAALGGLADLEVLDLHGNQLRGPLPAALGALANLEVLDVRGNQLRGPLPAALGRLTELEVLALRGNRLDGPLPAALSGLTDLEVLDLSGNRLDGPLPDWLGDLIDLEVLDVHGNRLSGPIPASLGDLANLQAVGLAGNAWAGCIPHRLRDLWADVAHDLSSLGLPFCLLDDLQLEGAALEPPFAAGTTAYTAAVSREVAVLAVTATLYTAGATVTIRKGERSYASGAVLPLDLGLNRITVEVVPSDGTPTQTVTVAVTRGADAPITLTLREGGDFVAVPAGAATTAADLFEGTDVTTVWQYNRATRAWDRSYRPGPGLGGFAIEAGDVLWALAPQPQMLLVAGTPVPASDPGPITLVLREGGDFVAVPAGAATTAADLFGGTDVTTVWQYNRATRAWDRSYRPGPDLGGFAIEAGDVLWVVAPRAQTVGG